MTFIEQHPYVVHFKDDSSAYFTNWNAAIESALARNGEAITFGGQTVLVAKWMGGLSGFPLLAKE